MKRVHHQTQSQSQSQCDGCGSAGGVLVHTVRYRGKYQRLCTACVLKNHPGSFCPVCFEVYEPRPPPPQARLMCLNCPSISHLSCVSPKPIASSYHCPPCSDPNFSFFTAAAVPSDQKSKPDNSDEGMHPDLRGFPVDKDMANRLVAAARIALGTMNKAAIMARVEAERRMKEAVVARKRAKEALERVAYLVAKEKEVVRTTGGKNSIRSTHVDASISTNTKKMKGDGTPLLNNVNGLHSPGN